MINLAFCVAYLRKQLIIYFVTALKFLIFCLNLAADLVRLSLSHGGFKPVVGSPMTLIICIPFLSLLLLLGFFGNPDATLFFVTLILTVCRALVHVQDFYAGRADLLG